MNPRKRGRTVSQRLGEGPKNIVENLDRDARVLTQRDDPMLQRMRHASNVLHFINKDGLWYHLLRPNYEKSSCSKRQYLFTKSLPRLVVPQSVRSTLMVIAHGLTGHRGGKPLVKMMSRTLYWPGLWAYVRAWVRSCSDCRRRKDLAMRQPGLLRPYQSCKP